MNDEKRARSTTISGNPPAPGMETAGAPQPIDPKTGMHGDYWVLSDEERAKGFVRPVRHTYKHVGICGPVGPVRDTTDEERSRYGNDFVVFEEVGEGGRFWTRAELQRVGKGCGIVTKMSTAIAETYAAMPNFYGATFCAGCRTHLPVGDRGEFVWEGTEERVGT